MVGQKSEVRSKKMMIDDGIGCCCGCVVVVWLCGCV